MLRCPQEAAALRAHTGLKRPFSDPRLTRGRRSYANLIEELVAREMVDVDDQLVTHSIEVFFVP